MKIILDAQGAQSGSRYRGVGRYVLNLSRALIAARGCHEIYISANSSPQEASDYIRKMFSGLLPEDHLLFWNFTYPLTIQDGWEASRARAAIVQRELYASIQPDIILLPAYLSDIYQNISFEIEFLRELCPVGVVIHDFLPFFRPDEYLNSFSSQRHVYEKYFAKLSHADILLGNSAYSTAQTFRLFPDKQVALLGCDTDALFVKVSNSDLKKSRFCEKLPSNFILYAGGMDQRKNVAALVDAYIGMPESLKERFPLIIATGAYGVATPKCDGKDDSHIQYLGYVGDEELRALYANCTLFVFPSLEEGFGLTALEAMRCGAPVIASNTTSIPEVVGMREALFDPRDIPAIRAKMERALTDENFIRRLRDNAAVMEKNFSWQESASRCLEALESVVKEKSNQFNACRSQHYGDSLIKHANETADMTVLFQTWAEAFDVPGGGEIQLGKYEEYLEKSGIRVLRYDQWHPQFDKASLVHVFSSMANLRDFVLYASKKKKLPVVLSSIFWPDRIDKYDFPGIARMYDDCDLLLTNSETEGDFLSALLGIPRSRFMSIVNGVDDVFFEPVSGEEFRRAFDVEGAFVLCMGNIEPRKNQLSLLLALAGCGLEVILCGSARDPEYAAKCMAAGEGFTRHIGSLEHGSALQRSAYAAASAVVLPSYLETPGLAALEASACGTPVAITRIGCAREYFGENAFYLDPFSQKSIRAAVLNAVNAGRNAEFSEHVSKRYRWKNAVDQLREAYRHVLRENRDNADFLINENQFISGTQDTRGKGITLWRWNEKFIHLSSEPETSFSIDGPFLQKGLHEISIDFYFNGDPCINSIEIFVGLEAVAVLPLATNGRHAVTQVAFDAQRPGIVSVRGTMSQGSVLILEEFIIWKPSAISAFETGFMYPLDDICGAKPGIDSAGNKFLAKSGQSCVSALMEIPAGAWECHIVYSSQKTAAFEMRGGEERIFANKVLEPGQWRTAHVPFELGENIFDAHFFIGVQPSSAFTLYGVYFGPKNFQSGQLEISPFIPALQLPAKGWRRPDEDGTFCENNAVFFLCSLQNSACLEMDIAPFLGNIAGRSLHVLVNGLEVFHDRLSERRKIRCFVPDAIQKAGETLRVELFSDDFPISPNESAINADNGAISFKIHSLTLTPDSPVVSGSAFSPFVPNQMFGASGWDKAEDDGAWMARQSAQFLLHGGKRDLKIEMNVSPFLGPLPERTLKIFVNGKEVFHDMFDNPWDNRISFTIPESLADKNGCHLFCLHSVEPLMSPKECGLSEDPRKLGFLLHEIRID